MPANVDGCGADTAHPHIDAPLTRSDAAVTRIDAASARTDAAPARTGADVTRHLSILKPRWNGSKQVRNRYFFTPKVVKHASPM